MVKKSLGWGLILLLLTLVGCQAGGVEKNVVFSKELQSTNGIENARHYNTSIQPAEAVEKAKASFQHYLAIQNIDNNLVLKYALIQNDKFMWNNPYWKLSWLGKDDGKLRYSAEIDAQTGEVILLRSQLQERMTRVPSKEELLACKNTALEFINKFNLVDKAALSLSWIGGPLYGGPYVEFMHGPGQFIRLHFDKAGKIIGFGFSQQISYTLSGNDLKINRDQAVKVSRESIKQFYGEVDTRGLIERVQLIEGEQGQKTWFVYWSNLSQLEDRDISYGAQINALSGKVCAVEGRNIDRSQLILFKHKPEELREIADQFLENKHLSSYRFQAYEKDTGSANTLSLRYRSKDSSMLRLYLDRKYGVVTFISFVD